MDQEEGVYDDAAREAVELGNRLADEDQDADIWDIADGLLAGAIQYWLYSRQPCGDPRTMSREARPQQYYHSPNDSNVGRA